MRIRWVLGAVAVWAACGRGDIEAVRRRELAEALEAFRSNIAAIHRRDVEGYLDHYLDSPELVVAGGDSLQRGFAAFAAARRGSQAWPDTLIAGEPTMVWLAPGAVYGIYPYTVVERGDTSRGWSERVFVKTAGRWKVVVTSRIDRPKR